MALRRQASFNPTLTNYAQGYTQALDRALAEYFAPTVRVNSAIGAYKMLSDKAAFQAVNTARALGGKARRIEFSETDPTYNCQPQALEITIDDAERDGAGDEQAPLEEGKTRTLISTAVVSHEDKVMTVAKTLAAVGGIGQWGDEGANPIKELDAQIEAIAKDTGMLPNAIAFGLGAWNVFRNHPAVIKRFPGAAVVGVTPAQAQSLLLNPGIEVRWGILSKDLTKLGATASKTNIIGAEVFIFIRSQNPTTYDASWMKTFTVGSGSVTGVRTFRDESARSDILAVDWSEDIQITSTVAARRISIS